MHFKNLNDIKHYIPSIFLLVLLNFFPALALNLLKGFLERSKISFNRFRTSAAGKYERAEVVNVTYSKPGFTLIEVMLAMMIAALTLAPVFLMYSTILRSVNR